MALNIQASILECVAIPFSKESSWPRDQTCIARRFFTIWVTKETHLSAVNPQIYMFIPTFS